MEVTNSEQWKYEEWFLDAAREVYLHSYLPDTHSQIPSYRVLPQVITLLRENISEYTSLFPKKTPDEQYFQSHANILNKSLEDIISNDVVPQIKSRNLSLPGFDLDQIDISDRNYVTQLLSQNGRDNITTEDNLPITRDVGDSLLSLVVFLERSGYLKSDMILDEVPLKTISKGVFKLSEKDDYEKYYVKVNRSLDETLIETMTLTHIPSTRFLSQFNQRLISFNNSGYLYSGGNPILLTSDGEGESDDPYQDYYFDMFGLPKDDVVFRRMYYIAAFHTEMKKMHIPDEYDDLFNTTRLRDEDSLRSNLANEALCRDLNLGDWYTPTLDFYNRFSEKGILAHNDFRTGNILKNGKFVDFGTVSRIGDSTEIIMGLEDVEDSYDRVKYIEAYTLFRTQLEMDLGNLWIPPPLFHERSLMRYELYKTNKLVANLKKYGGKYD